MCVRVYTYEYICFTVYDCLTGMVTFNGTELGASLRSEHIVPTAVRTLVLCECTTTTQIVRSSFAKFLLEFNIGGTFTNLPTVCMSIRCVCVCVCLFGLGVNDVYDLPVADTYSTKMYVSQSVSRSTTCMRGKWPLAALKYAY